MPAYLAASDSSLLLKPKRLDLAIWRRNNARDELDIVRWSVVSKGQRAPFAYRQLSGKEHWSSIRESREKIRKGEGKIEGTLIAIAFENPFVHSRQMEDPGVAPLHQS